MWTKTKISLISTAITAIIITAGYHLFTYANLHHIQTDEEFLKSLDWMYENELTQYNQVESFRPEFNLRRDEAAHFFVNFVEEGLEQTPEQEEEIPDFADLGEAHQDLIPSIEKAAEYWLIRWDGGSNNFRPADPISRAEFFAVAVRAVDGEYSEDTNPWWENYFEAAQELDLTKESDVMAQDRNILRYEAGLVLFRSVHDEWEYEFQPKAQTMEIAFDEEMDQESVLANMKTYPKVEYDASWEDDKTLKLEILDDFSTEETLLVNITQDAKTAAWENLPETLSREFKIDATPEIDFVSPKWDIQDPNQNITVRFSSPMVPLTALDDQPECPISFDPKIDWECTWITTSTFQFRPEKTLPFGWEYEVVIPSWFQNQAWNPITESKNFQIRTPDFEVVNTNNRINKDEPLKLVFNDDVDMQDVMDNFEMRGYETHQLDFEFWQEETSIEWEYKTQENIIEIFPAEWDRGYDTSLDFRISDQLTSKRWNVPLQTDYESTLSTDGLVLEYGSFIYQDPEQEDKNLVSNLQQADNNRIVLPEDPNILIEFNEEIELDYDLFDIDYDFELSYIKEQENETIQENQKWVIIDIQGQISDELNIEILASNISSSDDITLDFGTKDYNQIQDYEMINYKKHCLTTSHHIPRTSRNEEAFEFDGYWEVERIQIVRSRMDDKDEYDCYYEEWKNKYILETNLDPDTQYNLNISSDLLDKDNYPLDQDYEYQFTTPEVKNEDKHVDIIDQEWLVMIPSSIKPLTLPIKSVNIDTVNIRVCEWEVNPSRHNYIDNKDCQTARVDVENKWFQPSLNTVDLEQVFEQEFDSNIVKAKVYKLEEDMTESQKESYQEDELTHSTRVYNISDVTATLKEGKEDILWLRDYNQWENLANNIDNITAYEINRHHRWTHPSVVGRHDIDFEPKQNWLYELESIPSNSDLVITLENQDKVLVTNSGNELSEWDAKTYIFTDRPLYKPGDEVNIKWTVRNFYSEAYQIQEDSIPLRVRDSRWETMISETLKLDEYWSFQAGFDLPDDANLGEYTVRAGNDNLNFSVEEFETPDFEVEATAREDDYLLWETAQVDIAANYYMWLPVAEGEVSYELTSEDYYFDWWGVQGYQFGERRSFWWQPDSGSRREDRWELILDNNWQAVLDLDLEEQDQEDKIYNLSLNVQDPESWQNIAQNLSFKWLRTEKFVGVNFDDFSYDYLDTANIDLIAVDIDWNRLSQKQIDLEVKKVEHQHDEVGQQRETTKDTVMSQTLTTTQDGTVNTDFTFDEPWEYEFVISTPDGSYKTTKTFYVGWADVLSPGQEDNEINVIPEQQTYDVWDTMRATIQSPHTWVQAMLTVEKNNKIMDSRIIDIDEYNQEVQLEIKEEYIPNFDISAFIIKDVTTIQDDFQDLEEVRNEMSQIEQDLQERLDIPRIPGPPIVPYYDVIIPPLPPEVDDMDEEEQNLYEEWVELRAQEQELLSNLLPSYYGWLETIKVNTDYVKLDGQVSLDKEMYEPGDGQTIDLEITDNEWNPVDWQATIRVIDQALLDMMDNKQDILEFFYSKQSNNISTSSNLQNIIQRIHFPDQLDVQVEEDFETQQDDAQFYGEIMEESADMQADTRSATEDAAAPGDDEAEVREDFEDLAYYQSVVDVQNWQAQIQVDQLPDNLTTWVVDGFVHTQDTKVGEFETDFQVQKPIGILEQIPRFLISGDELIIAAQIANNTNTAQNVQTNLEISNATNTNPTQEVEVGPWETEPVRFPVEIDSLWTQDIKNFESEITISANAGEYQDAVRHTRNIQQPSTAEYVFTNGSTEDISYEEQVKISEIMEENWYLEITMWATILTNLMHNLDDYFSYPGESLRSRLGFLDIAESMRSLYQGVNKLDEFEEITVYDRDNNEYTTIQEVESKIKDEMDIYQEDDGWLRNFQDSCWHTRQSCSSFALSKSYLEMDLDIDGVDNEQLLDYYKSELEEKIERSSSNKRNISYFMPLAVQWEYDFVNEHFEPRDDLSNKRKIQYINLYELMPEDWERADEFYEDLKNSILIEARGSLLPADLDYSNNIISTAKMLQLMLDYGEEERLQVENMARWLLANRDEEWAFHARNIVPIIDALDKYVDQTGELDNVDFDAAAYFEENNIMEANFDMDNRFGLAHDKFDFQDYVNFGETHSLWFEKDGEGRLYYDVGLRYHIPNDQITPRDEWMIVSRNYYDYDEYQDAHERQCFTPIWRWRWWWSNCRNVRVENIDSVSEANHGDFVVWEVELTVPYERNDVVLRDYIPSGAEVLNVDFDTVWDDVAEVVGQTSDRRWWFDHIEQRNDMVYLYAEHLRSGTYTYTYVMQASYEGSFNVRPARAEVLDRPEVFGRSSGKVFEISR